MIIIETDPSDLQEESFVRDWPDQAFKGQESNFDKMKIKGLSV